MAGEQLNTISVRLHWNPPENPNGIITGYQMTYYGYRTTIQVQQVLSTVLHSYESVIEISSMVTSTL